MDEYIYLASPYSSPLSEVREQRFNAAVKMVADLMNEGQIVFSPVVHNHPVAEQHDLPGTWEYWEKYCTVFLLYAERIVVLKLDGWETSIGVQAEIKIAEKYGIPITYLET